MTPRRSLSFSARFALSLMAGALLLPGFLTEASQPRSPGFRGAAPAAAAMPNCIGENGVVLAVDNERALEMKQTAPLGKPYRALIAGTVTRVFGDRCKPSGTCHEHFEIQIEGARGNSGVVEVIYNQDFGDLETPRVGAKVTACGDFINAHSRNGRYDPSPSGAIIHWVHRSNCMDHEHGYVFMNDENRVVGFGEDRKRLECRPGVERRVR